MQRQNGVETLAEHAVAVVNRHGDGRYVILCDHASNAIPPGFGTLGLCSDDLSAHIAWDPGALGVAEWLARALDAPLIYPTVSRLIVDCNRAENAADLIPLRSETTAIPGNAGLDQAERETRLARVHRPFHREIGRLLDVRRARGQTSLLVSVHTFTPIYQGVPRPWTIGVLSGDDKRLARRLIASLRRDGTLQVGDNQPYAPADGVYYTLARHGEGRGLACAMLEIRNNELADARAQRAWAERLAPILGAAAAGL